MSLFPMLLDMELDPDEYGYYPEMNQCPLFKRYHQIPRSFWMTSNRFRTGSNQHKPNGEHKQIPSMNNEGFQIKMNVQNFAPNEISVKEIENTVVIEARHEERPDEHGSIFRHFIRKYFVPKECELEKVTSTLSSDGILTIKAPLKCQKQTVTNERIIEIQQTGPSNFATPMNDSDETGSWSKQ